MRWRGIKPCFLARLDDGEEARDGLLNERLRVERRELLLSVVDEGTWGVLEYVEYMLSMVNQQGCCCSRGLDTDIAHHVEDALVAIVPDACNDRQGEIRNVLSQCECVKTTHVARCSTSSYDYNAVEFVARDAD